MRGQLSENLAQLEKAMNAKFVADLKRVSPAIAGWAFDRLGEGFRLSEVQRVLSDMQKQARPE